MFYLKQNVDFYYNLKHNFSSFLSYIYGNGELKYYKYTFPVNINFQRKPFLFSLNEANKNISIRLYETIKNISSQAEEKGLFLFTKLKYIIRMNEIKEINQGETVREIVKVRNLPIYYYLKCEDKNENININFKIINYAEKIKNEQIFFEINGYLINEEIDFINERYINMDFQNSNNSINGNYDIYFNIGILNIKTKNDTKYVLIKFDSSSSNILDSDILIEVLAISKVDKTHSLLPVNKYIPDIYNSNENKTYLIRVNREYIIKSNKSILVELIPNCQEMKLESNTKLNLENDINYDIIQRYRVTDCKEEIILEVKSPQKILHCYYLLRYYYTAKHKEIKYKLKEKYIPKKGKNKKEIILDFNGIEIINKNLTKEMKFKIYGFLYKYENNIKNEFINPYFQNRVDRAQTMLDINNDFNFSLIFNDIKSYDNNDYKYYLQIKIYSSHKNNLLVDELFMMY